MNSTLFTSGRITSSTRGDSKPLQVSQTRVSADVASDEWYRRLVHSIDTILHGFSDMQLVTGLALLFATFYQGCSISAYHVCTSRSKISSLGRLESSDKRRLPRHTCLLPHLLLVFSQRSNTDSEILMSSTISFATCSSCH
jgi:hypothetical protein